MYDVFISHASEDKDQVARPLSNALQNNGLTVWYDEFTLKIGDSLRRTIEHGLANSRYGIVIISPSFTSKEWPKRELDALFAREDDKEKAILPIWHKVTIEDVLDFSPILADRMAVSTDQGIDSIVDVVLAVFECNDRTTLPIKGLITPEHERELEEYRAFFKDVDRRKFAFLIVGRAGVGKSSTINSLLGKEVAPVGRDFVKETKEVTRYDNGEIQGIRYSIIDTPGFADATGKDDSYISKIRKRITRIDCMWFVTNLREERIRDDEVSTIGKKIFPEFTR